jgi:hypothetical protein
VGPSPSQQIISSFCHLSANKWDPHVSLTINWIQIGDLLELQSICEIVVDFFPENVKWYHLVNFT